MKFKLYNRIETPQDPALFSPFSLFHFLIGVYIYFVINYFFPYFPLTYKFILWFVIHTTYEAKDIFAEGTTNSGVNSIGDTIVAIFGFLLVAYYTPDSAPTFIDLIIGAVMLWMASIIIPEPAFE